MQLLKKLLQTESRKMTVQRRVSMRPAKTSPAAGTMTSNMTGTKTGTVMTGTGRPTQTNIMEVDIAAARIAAGTEIRTEAEVSHGTAETAGKALEHLKHEGVKMNGR